MSRRIWVRISAIFAILATLASPIAPITAAQDDGCEPGQVLDESTGECLDDPGTDGDTSDTATDDVTDADAADDSSTDPPADDATDDTVTDDTSEGDSTDDGASGDLPTSIGNVVVQAFNCPAGWDVDAATLAASYDPCSQATEPPATIVIAGPDGIATTIEGVGELSTTALYGTALPPGTWTITQTSPGTAWVNCLRFDPEGVQYDQFTGPVAGLSLSFDLVAGDWLECEWFATGDDTGATTGDSIGALVATSHVCPYGITTANLRETFEDACIEKSRWPEPGIVASIDGREIARGMSVASDTTDVTFTPSTGDTYPSGTWTITQELTADYSAGKIWCVTSGSDGAVGSTSESDETGAVTIEVAPGSSLTCAFYAVEIAPRTGTFPSLTVVPHVCPAGTTIGTATLETCTLPLPDAIPLSFASLSDDDNEGGTGGSTQLSADLPQAGIEGQLKTGDWRITLDVPEGWPAPELTCAATFFQPTGETTPRTLRVVTPTDGTAGFIATIGVDHTVTCDAFIFTDAMSDAAPGDDGGSGNDSTDDSSAGDPMPDDITGAMPTTVTNVVLHSFACPAGWDVDDAGLDASYFPCQSPPVSALTLTIAGPVDIALDLEGGGSLEAATAYGPDLPPGTWTISQQTPGAAWANCLVFDTAGTQYDSVTGPVPEGSLSFELAAGDWLECEWFTNAGGDMPTTGAMPPGEPLLALNVQAFICPYGYGIAQDREVLAEGCTLKAAGETATLVATVDGVEVARGQSPADDPFVASMTPYDSGYLSGAWRLEQILPGTYESGIVYCQASPGTAEPRTSADSGALGAVSITVLPGEELRCVAYAIEASPREGAARGLTIAGALCAPGTLRPAISPETCPANLDATYPTFQIIDPAGNVVVPAGALYPDTLQRTYDTVNMSGTWRFVPTFADGVPFPEIVCSALSADGQAQNLTTVRSDGPPPGFDITVGVGHQVTCNLFILVDEPADPGTTTGDTDTTDTGMSNPSDSQVTDPATLTLRLWACDDSISLTDSFESLITGCEVAGEAVDVAVAVDAGITNLPRVEAQPNAVYCSIDAADNALDTFPERIAPDPAGAYALDIPLSARVYCDVFTTVSSA